MPLPIKNRRVGAVEYVLKRIKGSDSYENMKEQNESGGQEKLMMRSEPEKDCSIGIDQCVDEMMAAFESKDKESFKKGLRSFVTMIVDQVKNDEKLEEENE